MEVNYTCYAIVVGQEREEDKHGRGSTCFTVAHLDPFSMSVRLVGLYEMGVSASVAALLCGFDKHVGRGDVVSAHH